MTYYETIKKLTIDEMAEMLMYCAVRIVEKTFPFGNSFNEASRNEIKSVFLIWLESEVDEDERT